VVDQVGHDGRGQREQAAAEAGAALEDDAQAAIQLRLVLLLRAGAPAWLDLRRRLQPWACMRGALMRTRGTVRPGNVLSRSTTCVAACTRSPHTSAAPGRRGFQAASDTGADA